MKQMESLRGDIFRDARQKFLYGVFEKGSRFPSHSDLCKYYGVSAAVIHPMTKMLAEGGYIHTELRCNSVVTFHSEPGAAGPRLHVLDAAYIEESCAALRVLLLPLLKICLPCFRKTDFEFLSGSLRQAHKYLHRPIEYWLCVRDYWRYILLKSGSSFLADLLVAVMYAWENPGFAGAAYFADDLRKKEAAVCRMQSGFDLSALFRETCGTYDFRIQLKEQNVALVEEGDSYFGYWSPLDSLVYHEHKLHTILLDILNEMAEGRFQRGDVLPAKSSLCEKYGVSMMTVTNAFQQMEKGGIALGKRGYGTVVLVDPDEAREYRECLHEYRSRLQRLYGTLLLLSVTAEQVAAQAARDATALDSISLYLSLDAGRRDGVGCLKQLLHFLCGYAKYAPLIQVYSILEKVLDTLPANFFPEGEQQELSKLCLEAVQELSGQNQEAFPLLAAKPFQLACRLYSDYYKSKLIAQKK